MRVLISFLLLFQSIVALTQPPKKVDNRRGSSEAVARSIVIYGFRLPIQDTVCDLLNYNDTLNCIGSMVYKPEDNQVYVKKSDKWEVFALGAITESDPIFSAAAAAGISTGDISNWNTAFGWGNHASAGYLTAASITGKLNISDTAAMLGPYARSATIAATYVPLARTITINGTAQDLSANRTYTITNISGNAATATLASTVTTNANLTGPITSVGNATSVAAQTGTGSTFAMQAAPTFTGTMTFATGSGTTLNFPTTTGVGKINLPDAGTTNADGINWGTDWGIFRSSTLTGRIGGSGNTSRYLEISTTSTGVNLTGIGNTSSNLLMRAGTAGQSVGLSVGNAANNNVTLTRNQISSVPLFSISDLASGATGNLIQIANSAGTVGYFTNAGYQFSPIAPQATANWGVRNLGNGPFDGTTTGFFTGISTGTYYTANAASGYSGDFLNFQTAGVNRFKITAAGNIGMGIATPNQMIDLTSPTAASDALMRFAVNSTNTSNSNGFFIGALQSGNYEVWSKNSNSILIGVNNAEIARFTQLGMSIGSAAGVGAGVILDLSSTSKALLLPRMTTAQRNLITGVAGMVIFCTDCTATDGSTGVSQTFSSSSWRNHY